MSVNVATRVWKFSSHSGPHLLMLLAIADFADDGGNAYPSVATLAHKCRMKPRNANLILAALRASGELEVRPNQGPNGTNKYRIAVNPAPLQELTALQELAPTPVSSYPKPLQELTDKPSLNRQEPSLLCVGVPDPFDLFWSTYPRKVNKLDARKAFAKIKPNAEVMAQMLAAIDEQGQSEQWSKDAGRFIPHPASWLRGERWKDDLGQAGRAAAKTETVPRWVIEAGFQNIFEAENMGCTERNHSQFARGMRKETA